MRLRTDDRRRSILDMAITVFREVGYERASMALIAARLGGSKGTLYGYFGSKDALFTAAMCEAMQDQSDRLVALLVEDEGGPQRVLTRFGEAYLDLLTSPDALSMSRAAISEGKNSQLGATLYECPEAVWSRVADYLASLALKGDITARDTHVAAAHLKGMLEAGVIEPLLFGARPWFTAQQAAASAVEVFMRAYAPPAAPA